MVPGANILDQLLGGFEVKPTGQAGASGGTGVSAEGMEQGMLFGDLLLQSMTEGATGEETISNLLFPSNDQPAAQDEALAGPTVERGLLAGLGLPTDTVPVNVENLIGLASDPQALSLEAEKPLDLPNVNTADLQGLTQTDIDLESGSFRILDSKLVDGNLELTAVAENSTAEPVKITVPESVLKDAALRLSQSNPAVPESLVSKLSVDDLLSRLNLRMLEVKIEPEVPTAKQAASPVDITIVAEQSGVEVALKGKISRQALQVRSGQKDSTRSDKLGDVQVLDDAAPKKSVAAKATALEVGADGARRDANLTQFNLADRFGGERVGMPNDNFATQTPFDNTLETLTSGVERKTTPVVKMTLPEMIQKPFSAGGQTVMIKIEPEHLGPARLNLVMRDQVLTARVVVDTPLARMAVLNSLDQLTDQLSRAGVDVERIDVTLSGDSAKEQFLDHRPAWDYARKTQRLDEDFEYGLEPPDAAPVVTKLPNEYLNADRVNVLA